MDDQRSDRGDEEQRPEAPHRDPRPSGQVRIVGAQSAAQRAGGQLGPEEGEPAGGPDAGEVGYEPQLPHWTDAPTGEVPAVLSRPSEQTPSDDPWASVPSPTWREENTDWAADDESFNPSVLASEERLGALDSSAGSDQPWDFDFDAPSARGAPAGGESYAPGAEASGAGVTGSAGSAGPGGSSGAFDEEDPWSFRRDPRPHDEPTATVPAVGADQPPGYDTSPYGTDDQPAPYGEASAYGERAPYDEAATDTGAAYGGAYGGAYDQPAPYDEAATTYAQPGEAGQPGQPSYGQPSYGQPSYDQPSYVEPSYGQSAPYDEAASYGQPAASPYGEPAAYGEPPAYGAPGISDPPTSQWPVAGAGEPLEPRTDEVPVVRAGDPAEPLPGAAAEAWSGTEETATEAAFGAAAAEVTSAASPGSSAAWAPEATMDEGVGEEVPATAATAAASSASPASPAQAPIDADELLGPPPARARGGRRRGPGRRDREEPEGEEPGFDEAPPRRLTPPARPRPPAPSGARADRNLPVAVASGVAVGVLALICFAIGTVASMVLVVVVLTAAATEGFAAFRRAGFRPVTLLGVAAVAGMVIATYNNGVEAIPAVLVLLVAFCFLWYVFGVEEGDPLGSTAVTFLLVGWIGVFGSYAALLLAPSNFPQRHGIAFLLGAILTAVAYDVGALAVGAWIGRRPLAEDVSPNKTWEGLIGGAVAAVLVALVVLPFIHPWTVAKALALGVVVAVVAPVGDLCESLIKRQIGVKDMGRFVPGHGGLLDRFDALLFVLPATYYLVKAVHLG